MNIQMASGFMRGMGRTVISFSRLKYMHSSHSIDANTRVLLASMTQVAISECVARSVACIAYSVMKSPISGKPCPESKQLRANDVRGA
jgi:hypothetical protein